MIMTTKAPLFLLDSQTHQEVIFVPLPPSELHSNHRTIVLFDRYCDSHSCDAAHLSAYRVDGEVVAVEQAADGKVQITARRREGHLPDFYCSLMIRLSDGVVSFYEGELLVDGSQELRDQVQAGLVSEHLDMLRRRKRNMPDRFDEDKDWKARDWSWVSRGMCVGWVELFPKSKAWAFEHEGVSIFVDDQYCATASCDCSEVRLTFFRAERWGPDESKGVLLGVVHYDLRTRGHKLESAVTGSSAKTVLQTAERLFQALPAVRDELDRRFRFMRGFADWLAERRLAQGVKLGAGVPGRNAPCPCGSGRKYKKCCLT
jgi:hypothetical protein